MGVTNTSTGTCGSHLSQMGVTALVKKIPAGIICRGPTGPMCYALSRAHFSVASWRECLLRVLFPVGGSPQWCRAEEETKEKFWMMHFSWTQLLELFGDFFGEGQNFWRIFWRRAVFWWGFNFWRLWTFWGCSLLTYLDSQTLMGFFELWGCTFLFYSVFVACFTLTGVCWIYEYS